MTSKELHIKEVKDVLLSLPSQKERAPIALLGPIGIGKTASVKEGVQELAKVYNTPTVLISWSCAGGPPFVERIINREIEGKTFATKEVLLNDALTFVFYPNGSVEKMRLFDILPKYEEFLKDKYVVFLLEYFTCLPPSDQVKFVDFFDNFRIGIYDFKEHSKDVFIIIEGHHTTESNYTYDLDLSINKRTSIFSVYITQDYVVEIAKKLNWHPALQTFLQYEKINCYDGSKRDYISPIELYYVSQVLYSLDYNIAAGREVTDKTILNEIAGAIGATEKIEAINTSAGVRAKEKVPVAELIKAYYDAYRNTSDF